MLVVFRRLVKHHGFFVALEDVLYWFLSAFVMFAVILVANDGAARWFSIAGMVVGMVIVSVILKYMEKGGTIIYYKLGKVRECKDGNRKVSCERIGSTENTSLLCRIGAYRTIIPGLRVWLQSCLWR